MERLEGHDEAGERWVNSYGTDDPGAQARIEQARQEAAIERRRDRQRFELLVELGISPDDAEAFIEFAHLVEDRRAAADPHRPLGAPEVAEGGGDVCQE